MKTRLLSTLTAFAFCIAAEAENAPDAISKQCEILLAATQENDIEKFESVCDQTMKDAMNPQVLEKVSKQVSPLMKKGYTKMYMGSVDRLLFKTYYWKIVFKTEGLPEVLVQLSSNGEKVSGFFIQ